VDDRLADQMRIVGCPSLLDDAEEITDLWRPPGNRPKSLDDNLFSIRINDQWRIVFEWTDDGAENVEIIDYHD